MEKIKLLLNYAKNYWKHIALQILFATFWVGSNLIIPILMANIIDYGIARNDMNYIIQTGLQMILVTVLNIAFLLVNLYFEVSIVIFCGLSCLQVSAKRS